MNVVSTVHTCMSGMMICVHYMWSRYYVGWDKRSMVILISLRNAMEVLDSPVVKKEEKDSDSKCTRAAENA